MEVTTLRPQAARKGIVEENVIGVIPPETNAIPQRCDCEGCVSTEPTLWWMSFCDPTKPGGSQFIGALVLEVPPGANAHGHSHDTGLNPGGEAAMAKIPPDRHSLFPVEFRNRLMSKEEASSL